MFNRPYLTKQKYPLRVGKVYTLLPTQPHSEYVYKVRGQDLTYRSFVLLSSPVAISGTQIEWIQLYSGAINIVEGAEYSIVGSYWRNPDTTQNTTSPYGRITFSGSVNIGTGVGDTYITLKKISPTVSASGLKDDIYAHVESAFLSLEASTQPTSPNKILAQFLLYDPNSSNTAITGEVVIRAGDPLYKSFVQPSMDRMIYTGEELSIVYSNSDSTATATLKYSMIGTVFYP